MGKIGDNVKKAYRKIGLETRVYSNGGIFSGEYISYDIPNPMGSKLTRPILDASLPYDYSGQAGDVIEIVQTGDLHLLVTSTPDVIKNEVAERIARLVHVNCSGELYRSSETNDSWDDNYQKKPVWGTPYRQVAYSALFDVSSTLDERAEGGEITSTKLEAYMPGYYGIQVMDRYSPISGELYKVTAVKNNTYEGVSIVELELDVRED